MYFLNSSGMELITSTGNVDEVALCWVCCGWVEELALMSCDSDGLFLVFSIAKVAVKR